MLNLFQSYHQAKRLAQRSQLFRDGLRVFPRAEHVSVEATEELTKQCRALEERLHRVGWDVLVVEDIVCPVTGREGLASVRKY